MERPPEQDSVDATAPPGSRTWRRYRPDYGLVVGSGLLIVIASATLRSNVLVCSGFASAVIASANQFILILILLSYIVLPLLAVCIAVGGILGFAIRLPAGKLLILVATLAVFGGILLGSAPNQICGGGPWP